MTQKPEMARAQVQGFHTSFDRAHDVLDRPHPGILVLELGGQLAEERVFGMVPQAPLSAVICTANDHELHQLRHDGEVPLLVVRPEAMHGKICQHMTEGVRPDYVMLEAIRAGFDYGVVHRVHVDLVRPRKQICGQAAVYHGEQPPQKPDSSIVTPDIFGLVQDTRVFALSP